MCHTFFEKSTETLIRYCQIIQKVAFVYPFVWFYFLKYVHPSWKQVWYWLISSNVENLPIDLLKQAHICTAKRVTVAFYFLFWNCRIWKEIVQFHWNFLFVIRVPSSLARFTLSDDCTLFDQQDFTVFQKFSFQLCAFI